MSTFKKFTTAQTGTILVSNAPLNNNPTGISINSISVTNSTIDSTLPNCDVEVFIELTSGGDRSIMKVNVPQKATAVYDVPFSLVESGNLKINTSNNSAITVIIN